MVRLDSGLDYKSCETAFQVLNNLSQKAGDVQYHGTYGIGIPFTMNLMRLSVLLDYITLHYKSGQSNWAVDSLRFPENHVGLSTLIKRIK